MTEAPGDGGCDSSSSGVVGGQKNRRAVFLLQPFALSLRFQNCSRVSAEAPDHVDRNSDLRDAGKPAECALEGEEKAPPSTEGSRHQAIVVVDVVQALLSRSADRDGGRADLSSSGDLLSYLEELDHLESEKVNGKQRAALA